MYSLCDQLKSKRLSTLFKVPRVLTNSAQLRNKFEKVEKHPLFEKVRLIYRQCWSMGQQTVKRILHKVNLNYFPTICIPNTYISAMRLFQYLFPYIFLDLSNWFRTLYFWQFVRICLSRTHKDQGSLHQDSVKTSIVFQKYFITFSLNYLCQSRPQ